jgi:hypothetical protein
MCSSSIVVPLVVTASDRTQLEELAHSRTEQARLVQRAQIVLGCAEGQSHSALAQRLSTTRKTIQRWHQRFAWLRQTEPEKPVRAHLVDAHRAGAPPRIAPQVWVDILALATTDPHSLGLPFSPWSSRELERQVIQRQILPRIDHSTIHRFLSGSHLKPHQVQGWMNRKDSPDFDARAARVKQVLVDAVEQKDPTHAVLSYDEKTGIQAKERLHPDRPLAPGHPIQQEYEYVRHGTVGLLAAMLVHLGTIMGLCSPQRTNQDTASILQLFLGLLLMQGYRRITIVLDQLNTHMSQELIAAVALLCDLPLPSPAELDTLKKRMAWLEREDKPIVFLFTPVHASWLNPIEMWFSVLARRLLRRASFESTADLTERLYAFITYYNQQLAHPYKLRLWRPRPKAPRYEPPFRGSAPCVINYATQN